MSAQENRDALLRMAFWHGAEALLAYLQRAGVRHRYLIKEGYIESFISGPSSFHVAPFGDLMAAVIRRSATRPGDVVEHPLSRGENPVRWIVLLNSLSPAPIAGDMEFTVS